MTPEGKVKEEVKRVFKKHGVWYFMPVSGGYGQHGIPDFVACFKSRFIVVECKSKDGKQPTALQILCMERIVHAGGITFLATPRTVKELDELLEHME